MAQKIPFRPDIEGLRAIAILLVIAAHARFSPFLGGYIGVDVFFVLSGYLITGILVEETRTEGSLNLIKFYARRFRRLMPAMLFMLLCVSLLSMVLLSPFQQWTESGTALGVPLWISNFSYLSNGLDYYGPAAKDSLFLHTWSLSVEGQFYLIWPLLLITMLRIRTDRKNLADREKILFFSILTVLVASLSWNVLLTPTQPMTTFYMMPARAWQFSLGGLIWLWSDKFTTVLTITHRRANRQTIIIYLSGWLGFGTLVFTAMSFDSNTEYPGWRSLLPSISAAAMIVSGAIQNRRGTVAQLLSHPLLRHIGQISYSWYLWHWPVFLFGRHYIGDSLTIRGACVLASLVLAILSWRLIELPFRCYRGWDKRPSLMILLTLGMCLLASTSSMRWGASSFDRMQSEDQVKIAAARRDARFVCDQWYYSSELVPCLMGNRNAANTVLLIGDSTGAQWFPALQKNFENQNWKLEVLSKSACPMVDEPLFYARIGRRYTECEIWRDKALAYIAEIRPRILIVGSSSRYPFSEQEWESGTNRIWKSLSNAAERVYIIRATPVLPFNGPDCLASGKLAQKLLNSCKTTPPFPTGDSLFAMQQRLASGFGNVQLIDMTDNVCPDGVCSAEMNGVIAWRDTHHLTAGFAATLSEVLSGRIFRGGSNEE